MQLDRDKTQVNEVSVDSKGTGKFRGSWLGYGAEFFTVFFALAVLTGHVYAQSYWNVFGLSPELIETTFINYAIMSPNTALASLLMAVGTVVSIGFVRWQLPEFVGKSDSKVVSTVGLVGVSVGVFAVVIIPIADLSSWTSGTAGLLFGLGYLAVIMGMLVWSQAALGLREKEPPKFKRGMAVYRCLEKVPLLLIQIVSLTVIVSASLWGMMATAEKFGANEAKFMIDGRPIVSLRLDSTKGIEDLPFTSVSDGSVLLKGKIITQVGGFMYISTHVVGTPPQGYIRVIPVSRIQSIQYAVDLSPLGR